MSSNQAACQGGSWPGLCPPTICHDCPRTFIHAEGKAQLCPVCKGAGRVYHNADATSTAVLDNTKTCPGCGGKGWVTV